MLGKADPRLQDLSFKIPLTVTVDLYEDTPHGTILIVIIDW